MLKKNARSAVMMAVAMIVGAAALPPLLTATPAQAQVGGVRTTRLTAFKPTVVSGNRLEAKCQITDLNGRGLAGLYPVELYRVYPTYSVRVGSANTDSSGIAKVTFTKPDPGTTLAWNFAGNGSYSRPLHLTTAP